MIEGRVRGEKRKRSDNSSYVSEPYEPGGADTALNVAPQVHGVPAHDDRQGGVVAYGCKEYSGVLSMKIIVNLEQNRDSDDADAEREDQEQESMARSVRGPCDQRCSHQSHRGRWNCMKLGRYRTVTVGFDKGRRKISEACGISMG